MNPIPVVRASLLRNPFTVCLFTGLIALAVALGIAISVQERALRQGSARAADKFDLIVAAPGSQTDLLFAAVFLRPTAVELMAPAVVERLLVDPNARFAAPIAFGDSHGDSPVVGTIPAFVDHLSGGLAEGRMFAEMEEAVVGALVGAAPGTMLTIRHGDADDVSGGLDADSHGEHDDDHDHEGDDLHDHGAVRVVGRMEPTGTPWDNAVIVPVEYVWSAHGMGTGHPVGEDRIGPPWQSGLVPGLPVVVVRPDSVAAAYGLRARYRTTESTAFFPAEALLDLYEVMGGAVRVMSALTLAAQVLVVAAILAGLLAVLDLQRRRFAMLRAIGAPAGFVFVSVWLYVGVMVVTGAVVGLGLGWALSAGLSSAIGRATGVALEARIGARELWAVGTLVAVSLILAIFPAWRLYRMSPVEALR